MREYDHATCISALELRQIGVEVPADIPNCAWIGRDEFNVSLDGAKFDEKAKTVSIKATFTPLAPFRWFEADITFE